jgi:tetratricopeptide (TPR) repeat protein
VDRRCALQLTAALITGAVVRGCESMHALTPNAARARTDELALTYRREKPHVISAQISDHLAVVLAALRTRTMRPSERAYLLDVAVDTATMLGSAEFVGGKHELAVTHFNLAIDLAEESGQKAAIARACETASVIARPTYGRGDPQRAVALTERALSLAEPGPVRIRAALDAAEAYAAVKDRHACARMLTKADHEGSRRRVGRGFFSTLDTEFSIYTLCGVQGRCLSQLRLHKDAIEAFNDALREPLRRNTRLRSMWLADKAIALARAGKPDEACTTAHESLLEAQTTGNQRSIQRIRHLRTRLPNTTGTHQLDNLLNKPAD